MLTTEDAEQILRDAHDAIATAYAHGALQTPERAQEARDKLALLEASIWARV